MGFIWLFGRLNGKGIRDDKGREIGYGKKCED